MITGKPKKSLVKQMIWGDKQQKTTEILGKTNALGSWSLKTKENLSKTTVFIKKTRKTCIETKKLIKNNI